MLIQPVVRDTSVYMSGQCHRHGERFVLCPRCGNEVSLSLSYYDPYFKDGCQVHKDCLSDERKEEIRAERHLGR
jgi:hypothetical protein